MTNGNCPNCNASMPHSASFCANCGTNMQQSPQQPIQPLAQNQFQQPQVYYQNPVPQAGLQSATPAPGRIFLLIAGISYIVFSVISLLGSATNLLLIDEWLPFFGGEAFRSTWESYYLVVALYAAYTLSIGIMGVVNRKNLKLGTVLQWLVIGEVALYFILNLAVFNSMGVNLLLDGWTSWISPLTLAFGFPGMLLWPIDVALYILFIIGASKNSSANKAATKTEGT